MTFESSTNLGATLTRLSLGTILLAHGLLKLFVFTLPGTVAFFGSLGLPAIVAYLTVFSEVVGGVAILAGLYTRIAALLSLPVLLGSVWAHAGNGWLFSAEGGGWEFPALLVALAVAVAIQGGGAFAMRRLPVIDAFVPQALKA
jgi:putative oxidoreductase